MKVDIKISDIKTVVNRMLDHISETHGIDVITIERDYYWNIPSEDVYNMDSEIKGLDIGSHVDDWEFVSRYLDPNERPIAFQLTEVAPLLRYIGESLGRKLAKDGG